MYLRNWDDDTLKVHLHDEDDYTLTDDNGVDILFSKAQLARIVRYYNKHMKGRS